MVQLTRVERNQDQTWITVDVQLENAGDALESFRQWSRQNPMRVSNREGTTWLPQASESQGQAENHFQHRYRFDSLPDWEGLAVTYETPTAVLSTTVPFRIPLN